MNDALRIASVPPSDVGEPANFASVGPAADLGARPDSRSRGTTLGLPGITLGSPGITLGLPGTTLGSPGTTLRSPGITLRHIGARLVYWTPVFASLAVFAQVAFLGLRPALSEARRLADASDMLEARSSRDRGLYDAYELQLRVRQDPIFVERQRRLRCAVPMRASSGV